MYLATSNYSINDLVGDPKHLSETRNDLYEAISTGGYSFTHLDNIHSLATFIVPLSSFYYFVCSLLITICDVAKLAIYSLAKQFTSSYEEKFNKTVSFLKQDATLLGYCLVGCIPIIGSFVTWGVRMNNEPPF